MARNTITREDKNDKSGNLGRKTKVRELFKTRIRTATQILLEDLLDLANDWMDIVVDPSAARRMMMRNYVNATHPACSKQLYDLRRRGWISVEKERGQTSITFTNKAKIRLLEKISNRLEVDDKYRFVSFDIPEKIKTKRDSFRQAIKQLGFKQIQKSLWVTNRNVGQFVEITANEFNVSQYVVYIVADNTDINGILKKLFTKTKVSSERGG